MTKLLFLDLVLWIITLTLLCLVDQVGDNVIFIFLTLSLLGIIIPCLKAIWDEAI